MCTLKSIGLAALTFAVKVPVTASNCFPIDCEFQRFGGKRIFGYFMLMTAIATLLTPIGARGSPYLLITLRIIKGLGEVRALFIHIVV